MSQLRVHQGLLRPVVTIPKPVPNPVSILVLYDRKNSAIEHLAPAAAVGVELSGAARATLKRTTEASQADLLAADGLLLGCPNWSGITGSLKSWLDEQGDLWEDGSLAGKPAAAFTSGSGQHSGLEMTLAADAPLDAGLRHGGGGADLGRAHAQLGVILRGDSGGGSDQ